MNKLNKLRLVVSVIFIIIAISIIMSIFAVTVQDNVIYENIDSISDEDLNIYNSVVEKITSNTSDTMLVIAGYLLYAVVGMLFLLTFKLWSIKKI